MLNLVIYVYPRPLPASRDPRHLDILVEIAVDVGGAKMVLVPEDMGPPAITVSARQVATCNLLEDVWDVQGLQGSNFRDVSAIPVPQVLDEGGKWERPLVGADGEEKRWISVLTHGIYQVEILVLPERAREGLILQAFVGGAARLLRWVDGASDGFK